MPAWLIVILSILAVVLVAFIVLLILGGRLQKKANSQQEALASAAQTVSMLIIDKKKLKISEANLPKVVTDQVPKYARRAKFPIVKARVVGGGSKPMNLIADAAVFDIKVTLAPAAAAWYACSIELFRLWAGHRKRLPFAESRHSVRPLPSGSP